VAKPPSQFNQTYNRKVQRSEEALPALTEIASARGFIIGRSYPEKVKLAAGKAAAAITRRKP